jgi:hypothetical protein
MPLFCSICFCEGKPGANCCRHESQRCHLRDPAGWFPCADSPTASALCIYRRSGLNIGGDTRGVRPPQLGVIDGERTEPPLSVSFSILDTPHPAIRIFWTHRPRYHQPSICAARIVGPTEPLPQ